MEKNINLRQDGKSITVDAISQALSSIYTGVFFIDLKKDHFHIIRSPESIVSI